MSIHSAVRLAAVAGVLGTVMLSAGPAAADSTVTLTSDVRVGDSGTAGGTATFVRTLRADGTEVLDARASLLRPSVESSLCLRHDAFRHHVVWTGCPNKMEQTSEVSYTVELGSEYAGQVLHVQFRIRMPEFPDRPDLANGYAGWQPPSDSGGQHSDQFGEIALPAPAASPSPSPTPSTSPSSSPTPSPTSSPSASPTSSPSASPTSAAPLPSGVAGVSLVPTAVNAGSGGDAAPHSPVLPVALLLAGVGLSLVSARRLVRRR